MKSYLGDAVYASNELNPGHITLTVDSDLPSEATNIINLDPTVLTALIAFHEDSKREANEQEAQAIINLLPEHLRSKTYVMSLRHLDIDHLTHEEVLEAMKALSAGRWERLPGGIGGTLDYVTTINGWRVRLWAATPPGSCRVVEETVEIPAVPARTEIRKRVICLKMTGDSGSVLRKLNKGEDAPNEAIDPNVFDASTNE